MKVLKKKTKISQNILMTHRINFITIYCVNPILSLRKSLADWLAFKLPFNPKSECRDELLELKEDIETLINQSKQNKA